MRNFIWSVLMLFFGIFTSFCQTKNIEKGSYLSTNKGQKIKLNLLNDNKYELVFYTGEYKIEGDSLLLSQNKGTEGSFDLAYKNDKKAKKIKIKFSDATYYQFYIGTQKGSESVQYQKISDIKNQVDPEYASLDLDFEIDRTDYLYLVYEEYQGDSKLSKFALPKDVAEITIKYEPLVGGLNIGGFFDKKTGELRVSEKGGKNPLVFLNEKEQQTNNVPEVTAIENQTISNWTYPGKDALLTEDFGAEPAADSTAVVDAYTPVKVDFKLKIEDNLKSAITVTKNAKTKFLVIYSDSKNPSAKTDFDQFVKDEEVEIGYSMYDAYNPQFDVFNFYLATAKDKKWLKINKISDNPSVIILNGDGDVLATSNATLNDQKAKFNYYDGFTKKVQRTNALYAFNKVAKNKKATDAELILAFNNAASLEATYDNDADYVVTENVEPKDFKLVKVTLDKKEVSQIWKKLIEAHQKDTKPNMLLVETILKEIKNQGFSKQFFNEDRILNDADFLSIDYLVKHYDAIEKANSETVKEKDDYAVKLDLSTEISSALQMNSYVSTEKLNGSTNQNQIIGAYKKLIATGKGNYDSYKNYFDFLSDGSEAKVDNEVFLKEFNTYFNTFLSTEKGNAIERLDEMYEKIDSNTDYSYSGWNAFKEYHSNLANSAAWTVVLKPTNAAFLKSAITWSEYSLMVTKNNPYYLDTLAQLYYKDGQKVKAIETQKKAMQFSATVYEEETKTEMQETLEKMQNGTY